MESDKRDGGTQKLLFKDLDEEILRLIWFEVKDIPDSRLREYEFVRQVKGMLIALGVSERLSVLEVAMSQWSSLKMWKSDSQHRKLMAEMSLGKIMNANV